MDANFVILIQKTLDNHFKTIEKSIDSKDY
jgi:hypothetical protein